MLVRPQPQVVVDAQAQRRGTWVTLCVSCAMCTCVCCGDVVVCSLSLQCLVRLLRLFCPTVVTTALPVVDGVWPTLEEESRCGGTDTFKISSVCMVDRCGGLVVEAVR